MKKAEIRGILVQISIIGAILVFFLFCASGLSAQSVTRRYALYIGANYGGRDRDTLAYAVTDARTVSEVMQQLGGVLPMDSVILTDPNPQAVSSTMQEIGRSLGRHDKGRTEFFFYYSGHSDENGLLLGDNLYSYELLKQNIREVGADVNIAILDSCSSGAFTRTKGGIRQSPFLSDDSVNASGHAFLTSSSEDEAAQESDEIGASYFTYYLVTALRGAADSAFDGTVSLNEAYSYASAETLARTADSIAGPQHPSYDIQLAGTGDLILTDLREVSEQIVLDKDLRGRIFIRDSAGRLVLELKKTEGSNLAVSLSPGRYSMILDDGDRLMSADLMLAGGSRVFLMRDEFYPVPAAGNVRTRGASPSVVTPGEEPAAGTAAGSSTADELERAAERARKRALEAAGYKDASFEQEPAIPSSDTEKPSAADAAVYRDIPSAEGLSFGFVADEGSLRGVQVGIIGANLDGGLDGIQAASVFSSAGGDVDGVQLGGVFCSAEGNVGGFQAAGVFNSAEGNLTGAQFSGIWNAAADVSFVQWAGVFNSATGDVRGLQAAGVFNAGVNITGAQLAGAWNTAEGDVSFLQAAGVLNIVEGRLNGMQIAGLINTVKSDTAGLQVSGLFNSAKDLSGVQIAGLFNSAGDVAGVQLSPVNVAGKVYGVQIGLVNISEELHGVPIGLINISSDGLHDLSFWLENDRFYNFGYQLGTKYVYSFIMIGVDGKNPAMPVQSGLGIGFEIPFGPFFADIDLYAKRYSDGGANFGQNLVYSFSGPELPFPAIRLTGGIDLFGLADIFAGLSMDARIHGLLNGRSYDIGGDLPSLYGEPDIRFMMGPDNMLELYPSFCIGVRI